MIRRYAVWEGLHEDSDGQLVAFVDHEREVAALKAQLEVYTCQVTAAHGMNCPALIPGGDDCTCGLIYKVMVRGEQRLRIEMTEDRNRHALNAVEMMRQRDELAKRVKELEALLNTPEVEDFDKAIPLEAAHQQLRYGAAHDAGKNPEDWFWLIGYLAGKGLAAFKARDDAKAKHHCISAAAALRNWHAHIRSGASQMRPGISAEKSDVGK